MVLFSDRQFGLRIVGGQGDHNTRLYATVVKVLPGGIAELAGIRPGDKVISSIATQHGLFLIFYLYLIYIFF